MKTAKAMLGHVEVGRQAAFVFYTAAERHRDESAAQVIGPIVIGAYKAFGVAPVFAAELDASMSTAVLEYVERPIFVLGHYYGNCADERTYVVARLRYFAFKADKIPVSPEENALLLKIIDALVGVNPVRDERIVGRPVQIWQQILTILGVVVGLSWLMSELPRLILCPPFERRLLIV